MGNPSVLITDGDLKVALPVLRSLATKGIETGVAATQKHALSFFSKYCKTRFLYPSPRENLSLFIKTIEMLVKKTNYDILFPTGEWSLIPLSEHREKILPYIKLPFGSHKAVNTTFDKALALKLAMDEEVNTPKTFLINNSSDLREAAKKVPYPAVIKSRWSWVWNGDKAVFSRPKYANSPQDLLSAYQEVHEKFPFPIIQEYIPGIAYHVGALCNHSRLRAICAIKEHRTIPVTGGYATFRETVELDSKMKKYALSLLKALDWHGIAEVEFKLDSRDLVPKFMEINGRFWGSLELAIAAGVDFPYLLYRLVADGDVPSVFNYKIGVKRRWLEGDLIYLSNVLKNVGYNPHINYPQKLPALVDFLKSSGVQFDCAYLNDLLPFLSQLLWGDISRIAFRKIEKKLKGNEKD